MSKTIEEAAKDYAYDIGDSDWERMRLQDAFIKGFDDEDAEFNRREADELCEILNS